MMSFFFHKMFTNMVHFKHAELFPLTADPKTSEFFHIAPS